MTSGTFRTMRRLLLVALGFVLQGCLGPPDTFGDMWERVDEVAVPDDFTLVGKQQMGLRSGFAAAPGPTASNYYSVSWAEGTLCERLRGILEAYGRAEGTGSGTCGYETIIDSGWAARAVNVWGYELKAYAADPNAVANLTEHHDCPRIRKRDREQTGGYQSRYVPCWVTPGEALVTITLDGKEGW